MHDVIRKGPDSVEEEIYLSLKNENKETTEEELKKEAKKKMTAIIGANFDVIYLISQKKKQPSSILVPLVICFLGLFCFFFFV